MALKLGVQSKYKNLVGTLWKTKFADLRVSVKPTETWALACSKNYVAFIAESTGGGAVQVLHVEDQIRRPPQLRISGHTSSIQEVTFSPFNENVLCTSSDDSTVKLWRIPSDKALWSDNIRDPIAALTGHKKRIYTVSYNPSAESVIASGSCDGTMIVWDAAKEKAVYTVEHSDFVQSCDWNTLGSLVATGCRDKLLRIIDPRAASVADSVEAFDGSKAMKVKWVDGAAGAENLVVASGFGKMGSRYIKLWDTRKISECLQVHEVDRQTSFLLMHWDESVGILYTAGKGEAIIRPYTLANKSALAPLPEFRAPAPHKCVAFAHKRCVDVTKLEIQRAYLGSNATITPVSFQVPRKQSGDFQEDLFPLCLAGTPALSGDEWFAGKTKTPNRITLNPTEDGKVVKAAKTVNLESASAATATTATAEGPSRENAATTSNKASAESATAANKVKAGTAAAPGRTTTDTASVAAAGTPPTSASTTDSATTTAKEQQQPVALRQVNRAASPAAAAAAAGGGGGNTPPVGDAHTGVQPETKPVPSKSIPKLASAAVEAAAAAGVGDQLSSKRQGKPKTTQNDLSRSFSGSLKSHSAAFRQQRSSETIGDGEPAAAQITKIAAAAEYEHALDEGGPELSTSGSATSAVQQHTAGHTTAGVTRKAPAASRAPAAAASPLRRTDSNTSPSRSKTGVGFSRQPSLSRQPSTSAAGGPVRLHSTKFITQTSTDKTSYKSIKPFQTPPPGRTSNNTTPRSANKTRPLPTADKLDAADNPQAGAARDLDHVSVSLQNARALVDELSSILTAAEKRLAQARKQHSL